MTPLAPLALARSGAIRVPLSAFDACSRLQRCAPSPPSGGLEDIWANEVLNGLFHSGVTRDETCLVNKTGLKQAAAGGPDMQRTRFLASVSILILTEQVHNHYTENVSTNSDLTYRDFLKCLHLSFILS